MRLWHFCPMWVSPHMLRTSVQILVGVGSGWLFLAAGPAWGGPRDITVQMSCPVLSDISSAEFEARAKVDLSARAARGGELEVLCDNLAARIRWRPRGGAWSARAMPPTATPAALVDALLGVSKELVEEAARLEESAGADGGQAPGETPALAPSAADSSPVEGEEARDQARATSRTARPQDRAATPDEAAAPSDRSGAAFVASREWGWGVAVGTQAALFSFRGTGIVGPSVGAFLRLPAGFAASLTGEYDVGIGTGDVVSVRMATVAAVIAAQFGPARAFEVGLGGFGGSFLVDAEPPYQPISHSVAFWGALVRGRYGLRSNGWRFAAGPEVRFHGIRPQVAVDRADVWNVPAISVGLGLEVAREF
jgi:hypothetical protein